MSSAMRSRGFELGDHLLLGLSCFILALDLRCALGLGAVDYAACIYFYLFLFSLPHLGPPSVAWRSFVSEMKHGSLIKCTEEKAAALSPRRARRLFACG